MAAELFQTVSGQSVTAVSADEMRAVDRVSVEDVGVELLQLMENAGRSLAWHVRDVRDGNVVIVAGNGGNGGGGLACARHLANRNVPVTVVLDRPRAELTFATAHQCSILDEMDISITDSDDFPETIDGRTVIVDALIGYGLSGDVRPPGASYIDRINDHSGPIVSLDVPSGLDATTGKPLGKSVAPDRTVTLALPKTGLDSITGTLYLADIGIPPIVYEKLDISYEFPFGDDDWVRLEQ